MSKSVSYQIRLSDTEKNEAFSVFRELGINPAQAVRLFLRQVVVTRSIPFPIGNGAIGIPYPHACSMSHTPSKATEDYLLLPDSEKDYKSFSNLNDLFADLEK
jgi:addiction module RelB/DinJ family antitoxin